jgi:hypothetical protein
VLRKTFGPTSDGETHDCKRYIMRCFTGLVRFEKTCRVLEGKCVLDFGVVTGGQNTI